MIATIRPGSTAPTAGAVTCASTLPTHTATPSLRPAHPPRPPLAQPRPPRGLLAQRARQRPQRQHRVLQLRREIPEVRMQCPKVVPVRAPPVLQDPLVAGGTRVARLHPGQLPGDPVRRLDPPRRQPVTLRIPLQQLQTLGVLPLRRDPPPVAP